MYVSDFIKHFLKNLPFGHSLVVIPLAPCMTGLCNPTFGVGPSGKGLGS
jgi:hypothetical protein